MGKLRDISTWLELLDGKFAGLTVTADCFVDSAIGSGADEADDFVAVDDPDFTLVTQGTWSSVNRFYIRLAVMYIMSKRTHGKEVVEMETWWYPQRFREVK